MKYTGRIPSDALISDSVLNFVDVKKQDGGIEFVVGDDMASAIAEELSRTLKPGPHAAVITHEYDSMVVFPGKVFRFTPKEVEKRQKALDYAKTLGIQEANLSI